MQRGRSGGQGQGFRPSGSESRYRCCATLRVRRTNFEGLFDHRPNSRKHSQLERKLPEQLEVSIAESRPDGTQGALLCFLLQQPAQSRRTRPSFERSKLRQTLPGRLASPFEIAGSPAGDRQREEEIRGFAPAQLHRPFGVADGQPWLTLASQGDLAEGLCGPVQFHRARAGCLGQFLGGR